MIASTVDVSELCCENAFSASCNKANRKKQNNDSEFVLFSQSTFSRDEFFSAIDSTFF